MGPMTKDMPMLLFKRPAQPDQTSPVEPYSSWPAAVPVQGPAPGRVQVCVDDGRREELRERRGGGWVIYPDFGCES